MEVDIDENGTLDYAVFHTSPTQNSYEALACRKGNIETVASGPLDQLALYLTEAKGCQSNQSDTSFKLQLIESQKGFSWFTKVTLARFLHIVHTPEARKAANAIAGEMTQLEETKKFHISLYVKDRDQSAGGTADASFQKEVGLNQQIKVETASSDATKNELLRALDLRLIALEEELAIAFSRAAGATCSTQQISDLSAFCEHFGAIDLRNFLLKLLAWRPKNQPSVVNPVPSQEMKNNSETAKPMKILVSPAKLAQVERQSSSESEESSDSSDKDQSCTERSRLLIRSATPRRSASPMRRVQIGRSGSRRSTAITIKSLNYFPAREKTSFVGDDDKSNSGDEEPEQPAKKPENAVRRMSVQDAISLFESKQKDQTSDVQKRKVSGDVSSASTTAKSVLRRWSVGMGDSFSQTSCENSLDAGAPQDTREETNAGEVKVEAPPSTDDSAPIARSSEVENSILPPMESPAETVESKLEEGNDKATASAEWTRQKEAELNQMLMKMMESKPRKHQGTDAGSGEKRGGFYSQYREKRDEKLRAENSGKTRAVKEAQFKVMKETLEQSKAEMASKTASSVVGKRDSPGFSQKPRRNSSPPVLPKKEGPKPTITRKDSPKASPLPATRKSWSGSLPKTNGPSTPKAQSSTVSTTTSSTNRRKPISTPSPTQPSPRTEKLQKTKGMKGTPPDAKPSLKVQEEKKPRSVTKSSKSATKTKSPSTAGDDSSVLSAKPSVYNKVTKKSTVVPLESKPFLKKGTGLVPRGSFKPKVSQPDDSSINSGNCFQSLVSESMAVMTETSPEVLDADVVQAENHEENLEQSLDNDLDQQITETSPEVLHVPEIQVVDEDIGISSPAWVEMNREGSASCDIGFPNLTTSPEISSAAALVSPRIRHSLSQMLQADNNEPEIIEWGNAENPPSLVYQKDAPKGFKRLLKFARKSKGDANTSGWASPSVNSEGEDDTEESKAASKRSSDALLRKAALQAKGYEPPKSMVVGSSDGGNSSRRSMEYRGMNEIMPAQSSAGTATILDRLREGQNSASATSTKATRSFFSLSTFRSNKSSEAKLR